MSYAPSGSSYSLPWRLLSRFGWRTVVAADWSQGIVRDMPRSSLPAGSAYDLTDYLIDQPGILYKRGHVTTQCTGVGAAGGPAGIAIAPFDSTHIKVVGFAFDGSNFRAYDCTSGTASAVTGTCNAPSDPPKFLVDKLVVLDTNVANPQKITISGSSLVLGTLGGSPPQGRVGCVHLSRFLIANTAANPNRVYFSQIPDIEATWDTTNAYIDFDEPITAMASLQGVLIVFSKNRCWRVLGDIPPGDVNENMQVQPLAAVGAFVGSAVATSGGFVYFAGQVGVYSTNGASVTSLTDRPNRAGISSYWQGLSNNFTSGSSITLAVFQQKWLVVSYTDATGPAFVLLKCYLPSGAWVRDLSGFSHMYASLTAFNSPEKLYAASVGTNKTFDMTGTFRESTADTVDADSGGAVLPYLETGVFGYAGTGPQLKAYGHAHLTYDLRDPSSDNPTLVVKSAPGIEATTFTAVAQSPLAETTDAVRARFDLCQDAQGISLSFKQANASSFTRIRVIEVEERSYSELGEGQ